MGGQGNFQQLPVTGERNSANCLNSLGSDLHNYSFNYGISGEMIKNTHFRMQFVVTLNVLRSEVVLSVRF